VPATKVLTARLRANEGRDDVLATGSRGVQILYTGPAGALTASTVSGSGSDARIAVGDFDADGNADAVTVSSDQLRSDFALGDGAGGFRTVRGWIHTLDSASLTDLRGRARSSHFA